MNEVKVKAVVLESNTGKTKSGKAYTIAVIRVEKKVMKIFSDIDLSDVVDEVSTLVLRVSANREMFASVSVASVEK